MQYQKLHIISPDPLFINTHLMAYSPSISMQKPNTITLSPTKATKLLGKKGLQVHCIQVNQHHG